MTLLTLVVIGMNIGCEDRIESPVVNTPEGKMVDVSFAIGLDDATDGATLYPHADTKAGATEALSAQLVPAVRTKANECPDELYYLDIHQYKTDANGTPLASPSIGTKNIGDPLTVSLNDNNGAESQLLIIARGATQAVPSLSGKSLTQVRQVLADAAKLNTVGTDGTNINNMPYLLYLPKVKVADGKLQSPDGTDVRLRLKRLAVKLSLNWKFGETMTQQGYELKEVRLFQVPADYRILPAPESTEKWGTVYPSSVSEFVDGFRLKGTELTNAQGNRTIWMPANAQGSSSAIVYPSLRSKRRVNPATTYAEFVVDNADKKERFYFRVYLGGNTTTDFNLFENTDYNWSVNINSVKYTTDDRISLLDQTPVISNNLQPTANCFMMQPGTNICFNPYKHTSGTNGWNTYLTDGSTVSSDKIITNVKVLWQTKDAGTSGDLVMGYVIDNSQDASDHKNLVNLTSGSDKDKARIHVKVPVTNGGNAVIAAYNSSNEIVWSWHLWITDYVPQGITSTIDYEQAQKKTQGGSVHQYPASEFQSGIYKEKVMMDRNLCATAGGFPGAKASNIEFAKRYGYQYQWGRKDPFFGSVDGTTNEVKVIFNGDGEATAINLVTYASSMLRDGNTLIWSIQHPMSFIYGNTSWYNGNESSGGHNMLFNNNGKKALYDPCPKGWTIAYKSSVGEINMNNANWFDTNGFFRPSGSVNEIKGGRLYNLSGNSGIPNEITIHNSSWFSVTSYRSWGNGRLGSPTNGYYGFRDLAGYNNQYYYIKFTSSTWEVTNSNGPIAESVTYRCIQE